MSDRAVQDEVIRYLADASVRGHASAPIPASEAAKAARFAQFLARRYYCDRLARSFRYSHRFFRQTGRTAEQVVDGAEFGEFLSMCVMGSLASAQRVGEMARAYLAAVSLGPWWLDLLDYEYCYFLQAATAEHGIAAEQPSPGVSALCRRFAWSLPQMLSRLRAGELIGDDLQRGTALLFSRTHAGRIYVVEVEPTLEQIFCAVDGRHTVEQIAAAAAVSTAETRATLVSLANIGAVEFLS